MTERRHTRPSAWMFAAVMAVAAFASLRGPPILHGDGREYILQTQSLLFDHSVRIDPEARRGYWNQTNPYGIALGEVRPPSRQLAERKQAGGGFGGLYPDRFGHYRYYHFWLYSAIVAPVYAGFHLLDPSGALEYFSFRFVNAAFLLLFFLLAYRQAPGGPALAVLALLLFSPLIPYCDWAHPEIFCLTLVFAAFLLSDHPRGRKAAPLLLGLAASMNPPILFFFPALFLFAAFAPDRPLRHAPGRLLAVFALGGAVALSSMAYFQFFFRTPSVISHIGLASFQYASLARALDIFFNPFIGAALFFPMPLLALPAFFRRGQRISAAVLVAGVLAAAWLCSATANFNAGQVGTVRYAVWLLAPLWFALFRRIPRQFQLSARGAGWIAALLLSAALGVHLRTYQLLGKDIRRFGGAWRARPEIAAILRGWPFAGDAEVLAENIMGEELRHPSRFRDVYLWDLGHDRQLWLLPERAIFRNLPVFIHTENPQGFSLVARPAQSIPLDAQDGWIRLSLSLNPPPRMYRHPVLGNYLILRSQGHVDSIATRQPLRIRSGKISVELPPDDPQPAATQP